MENEKDDDMLETKLKLSNQLCELDERSKFTIGFSVKALIGLYEKRIAELEKQLRVAQWGHAPAATMTTEERLMGVMRRDFYLEGFLIVNTNHYQAALEAMKGIPHTERRIDEQHIRFEAIR